MKLLKLENNLLNFLVRNNLYIFFIFVTIFGFGLRYSGRAFKSNDALMCLIPWYETIKANGGFSALKTQVGNYGIPYQTIIAAFTKIPYFSGFIMYKILSCFFDYVLAFGVGMIIYNGDGKQKSPVKAVLAYSAVIASPAVVLNSSVWAQCDSIYTAFCILSIYFMIKKRYNFSFAFFGIAFGFKLQAIFILPFILIYYVLERKFSILTLAVSVISYVMMCVPALAFGRNYKSIWEIYMRQTEKYPQMYMNYPSFWVLVGDRYDILKTIAILTTIFILGAGLLILIRKRNFKLDIQNFIAVALWSVWACVLFLPAMHERYGYLIDILSIIWYFMTFKFLWLPIICNFLSVCTYCSYLFDYRPVSLEVLALINVGVWIYFSYFLFKDGLVQGRQIECSNK